MKARTFLENYGILTQLIAIIEEGGKGFGLGILLLDHKSKL